jgi:hypothetical protein
MRGAWEKITGREKGRSTPPGAAQRSNRKRREEFIATLATIPPEKQTFPMNAA